MNWILIILIGIAFYGIHQLGKGLDKIEEKRGLGNSEFFTINVRNAIYLHPRFLKESKIKGALKGKHFKDMSEKDRTAFGNFIEKQMGDKGWLAITYLANENAFFIRDSYGKTNLILSEPYGTTEILRELIIGDENGIGIFENRLEFRLTVKNEKDHKGQYRDFLIGYIKEEFKEIGKKAEVQILFRYPFGSLDLNNEDMKALGFKIEVHDAGDFENFRGEIEFTKTIIEYSQNNSTITRFV